MSEEPLPTRGVWVVNKVLDFGEGYKPEDHKVILSNLFGTCRLGICDPAIAQEIFSTKNKFVDKTGLFQEVFEDVIGSSFLFSKGGEDWNRKRKACAHAFYKDRMEKMMEVLKEKLAKLVTEWNKKIEASSNGQIIIDIAQIFE